MQRDLRLSLRLNIFSSFLSIDFFIIYDIIIRLIRYRMKNLRRAGKPALVVLSTFLFFFSCSGDMLLTGDRATPEFLIKSVAAGTVLGPGVEIPLSLVPSSGTPGSSNPPERMEVRLESGDGVLIATTEINEDLDTEELPSLQLPEELAEGLYRLVFRLYRGGELLQESVTEFFSTTEKYRLNGISSYPPSLYPGSRGILEALLDPAVSGNPYLVWRSGDRVFKTGYLDEGAGQAEWKAPGTEGVYNVRLELFPVGPANGSAFPFSSSIHIDTELFVSKNPAQGEYELPNGKGFYSLLHFRGNLRDEGSRKGAADIPFITIGNPALAKDSGIFGFLLDGTDGFSVPDLMLPVRDGTLEPFTVEARIQYMPDMISLPDVSPHTLFTAVSAAEAFSFSIVEEGGILSCELASGSLTAATRLSSFELPVGKPVDLALSIATVGGELNFSWFINGYNVLTQTHTLDLGNVSSSGQSTIGGETGFPGIIDEFGIYSADSDGRPSIDPELFIRGRKADFGRKLIFAEGFDGLFLPKWINGGESFDLASGILGVNGKARIDLPPVTPAEDEGIELAIAVPGNTGGAAVTVRTDEKSEALLTIPLSAVLPVPSSEDGVEEGLYSIRITSAATAAVIRWYDGEETRLESLPLNVDTPLYLSLENTTDEEGFHVDSISYQDYRIPSCRVISGRLVSTLSVPGLPCVYEKRASVQYGLIKNEILSLN